jgi:hypothetical protein
VQRWLCHRVEAAILSGPCLRMIATYQLFGAALLRTATTLQCHSYLLYEHFELLCPIQVMPHEQKAVDHSLQPIQVAPLVCTSQNPQMVNVLLRSVPLPNWNVHCSHSGLQLRSGINKFTELRKELTRNALHCEVQSFRQQSGLTNMMTNISNVTGDPSDECAHSLWFV